MIVAHSRDLGSTFSTVDVAPPVQEQLQSLATHIVGDTRVVLWSSGTGGTEQPWQTSTATSTTTVPRGQYRLCHHHRTNMAPIPWSWMTHSSHYGRRTTYAVVARTSRDGGVTWTGAVRATCGFSSQTNSQVERHSLYRLLFRCRPINGSGLVVVMHCLWPARHRGPPRLPALADSTAIYVPRYETPGRRQRHTLVTG